LTLVHVAASQLGGGYSHINHIFLPQNQDVCVSGDTTATVGVPTGCYSPDNQSAFTWCAFHASVDFPDIGHVIFSIEPYQNVSLCVVAPQPSPNGALVDSTANSLSHELFEMITDPDTNAWLNRNSVHLFGAEIGDLCENSNFEYGVVQLNGRKYQFQAEYSNAGHVCTYSLNMH
jgi:hypothetical protein